MMVSFIQSLSNDNGGNVSKVQICTLLSYYYSFQLDNAATDYARVHIKECSSVFQCPSHHPASHHTFSQTVTEMEEV